jgi:hypothetical protein
MNEEKSHNLDVHAAPGDGVHHYENATVSVSDGSAWYETKAYKSLVAMCRVGVFVVAIGSFCFGAYLYQRDVNAQSSVSVADTARDLKAVRDLMEERKRQSDSQFGDLRNSTVTIAVFNAQFEALNKRLDRIEVALDRMNGRP